MHGLTDGSSLMIVGCGEEEYVVIEAGERYVIAEVPAKIAIGGKVIMCRTCKMVSANPDDVVEKYCGHCHEFLL
jgi:hypothetical protein